MQLHTHISPIQTALVDSQEISSNEELSSTDGTKIMKSMTALMGTLQNKEFSDLLKTHNEMEQTLKKNTYEVHIVNKSYTKFEKNFFKRKTELLVYERANVVDLHNEDEEDAKVVTEKEKNLITQGEDNSRRRGGSVSTGTRSKRKPTSNNNDRLIKRGGGRSGDRGGRSGGGDRGGRSGIGRGGRSLPPFHNLLTSEELSYEGHRYPIDPLVKREEQ
ncbi:inhibitor of growth protein 1 homolog [Impatiens glandulifera]|uniref:inhibitor of growth protein 1 homolog n=1 Tax=Impatiens glandulifera TaxID=253017 RepID=UPI001FB12A16|nr:inhibitor of growth protein 1 homolog [Impatiens glandulifera]